MNKLVKLEDRVLILQDAVDVLTKYSPDQPRDEAGRWTEGGSTSATRVGARALAFHGTSSLEQASILRDGLLVSMGGRGGDAEARGKKGGVFSVGERNKVYVTKSPAYAAAYAVQAATDRKDAKPVVLKLRIPKTEMPKRIDSPRQIVFNKNIKPEWITAVAEVKFAGTYGKDPVVLPRRGRMRLARGVELGRFVPVPEHAPVQGPVKKAESDYVTVYLPMLLEGGLKKYDPNQPRDDGGRWSSGGGSGAPGFVPKTVKQIQGVLPQVKEVDIESLSRGRYRVALSTARYNGIIQRWFGAKAKPVVSVMEPKETGVLFVVDPKNKTIKFEELRSHIKGAGRQMVDAIIANAPKDYKFTGEDGSPRDAQGRTWWDNVSAHYPDRVALKKGDLEERVLMLQDQVDVLAKEFDPNQPRHPAGSPQGGEFAPSGGGGSGSDSPSPSAGKPRSASSWLSSERVKAAAKSVLDVSVTITPKTKEAAKNLAATVAAAIITQHDNSDLSTEAIKTGLLNLSDGLKVSVGQARDTLVSVMEKLKKTREDDINKASDDPVIKVLDAIIAKLKAVDVEALERARKVTKLEDRLLELQDQVDMLAKKFNPNQPRDQIGRWTEGSVGGPVSRALGTYVGVKQKQTRFFAGLDAEHENKFTRAVLGEPTQWPPAWKKWAKRAVIGALVGGAIVLGAHVGYHAVRAGMIQHFVKGNQRRYLAVAAGTMRSMGLKPEMMEVDWDTGVGALGMANSLTKKGTIFPGRIKMFANAENMATLRGTIAHEATHLKAYDVMSRRRDIWEFIDKNKDFLTKEGGVTPYSKSFWKAAADPGGGLFGARGLIMQTPSMPGRDVARYGELKGFVDIGPYGLAVQETLAEMSAVKQKTGKLPGGPTFKQLHSMIMSDGNYVDFKSVS